MNNAVTVALPYDMQQRPNEIPGDTSICDSEDLITWRVLEPLIYLNQVLVS